MRNASAAKIGFMTNDYHETNRKRWDEGAEQWARSADSRGLWRRQRPVMPLAHALPSRGWFGIAGPSFSQVYCG